MNDDAPPVVGQSYRFNDDPAIDVVTAKRVDASGVPIVIRLQRINGGPGARWIPWHQVRCFEEA